MARRSIQLRGETRGAALLELALVLPLFLTVLLFGLYLAELARAKIRLLEAGRYVAWELTSYPLSDYGGGNGAAAFAAARRQVIAEAVQRYRDLDPAEDVPPRGFGVELEGFEVQLQDEQAPLPEPPGQGRLAGDGNGSSSRRAVRLAGQGARAALEDWGFDLRGQVRAEVSIQLRSTLLPRHVRLMALRSHHALIADGWQLADGADASITGGHAGYHPGGRSPSGLYLQVKRMRFWGDEDFVDPRARFLDGVRGLVPFALPSLSGAFVVSHNYGLEPGGRCEGIPGYPAEARSGLSNLEEWLDHPKAMCFDTAPFRDTQEYAHSLYLRMFRARGGHFMGCQNAQADDPSSPKDPNPDDRFLRKIDCEVAP